MNARAERSIEWHATIDSTMRRAAELARAGAAAGAIVGADQQTAGQGRLGRPWFSASPGGLYFTMILRPRLEAANLPLVTLTLGLAVADSVQMFTGLPCDLRWPNDVLANGRKLAGILTQMHDGAVLAGIGLNVNQPDFPEEIREIATSIVLETGTEHDKHFLLRAIAGGIETHVNILETSGGAAILRLFTAASSYVSGRRVAVELPAGETRGITAGLTPEGFLLLDTEAGERITITAGGVRPLA
ncbi:MAG: biotin--[acetyl-CoA-carboxylase] ligase [Bryobacteraceae bacterium]|nr:biotin--[acetyl-CoA-carboxylase] ligase [Bryobacteraceae bacterium]